PSPRFLTVCRAPITALAIAKRSKSKRRGGEATRRPFFFACRSTPAQHDLVALARHNLGIARQPVEHTKARFLGIGVGHPPRQRLHGVAARGGHYVEHSRHYLRRLGL